MSLNRFACPLCPRGFYSATGLRIHLKLSHDEETSDSEVVSPTQAGDGLETSDQEQQAVVTRSESNPDRPVESRESDREADSDLAKRDDEAHDDEPEQDPSNVEVSCEGGGNELPDDPGVDQVQDRDQDAAHVRAVDLDVVAFECPECGKKFRLSFGLKRHLREAHGEGAGADGRHLATDRSISNEQFRPDTNEPGADRCYKAFLDE